MQGKCLIENLGSFYMMKCIFTLWTRIYKSICMP